MFRGDVGDEQRRADEEPPDIAACQEIIFRRALFPRKIKTKGEYDDEVHGNDGDIYGSQRSVCGGCSGRPGLTHESCEEHSCLPLVFKCGARTSTDATHSDADGP